MPPARRSKKSKYRYGTYGNRPDRSWLYAAEMYRIAERLRRMKRMRKQQRKYWRDNKIKFRKQKY